MRAIAAVLFLTGCASGLQVTYESQPPGASIIESGKIIGTAPVTVPYHPPESFTSGGCVTLAPVTAQWISGARTTYQPTACRSTGTSQRYVFQRPAGAGMDIDANYALQLQRNQIMKDAAWSEAFDRGLRQGAETYPKTTNCTTTNIGGMLQTSCY